MPTALSPAQRIVLHACVAPYPVYYAKLQRLAGPWYHRTLGSLMKRGLVDRIDRTQNYNLVPGDGGSVRALMGFIATRAGEAIAASLAAEGR